MDSWYDSAVRSRRDLEVTHYKEVCKCGIMVAQCRCPGQKVVRVTDRCDHKWAQALEDELSEQYDVPANAVVRPHHQHVEVELPATRHSLDISLTNVYGFVITLSIGDETGGLLKEIDLYSCVKREDLADTIHSLYTSYE